MMDEIDEILDKAPFYIEQVGIRQVREKVYYSESAINSPKAAVDILAEEIRYYDREVIGIVNVDSKLTPLNVSICSIGTINRSLVNPREMLKTSILSNASGVVVMHNHPSGSIEPSEQDFAITKRLAIVYRMMGIDLLDHIIVGDEEKYYSFSENDKIPKGEITFDKLIVPTDGMEL
ncbi:MAG: JAB domain-containing protein [Eubacterium sp.]|nr:JAB domain-containing protein [Eubacterium sp.]